MKLCVQGLWHLGTVTAACLASIGHHVVGFDFEAEVVQRLAKGVPPVFEPGLVQLVETGLQSQHLSFVSDPGKLPDDIEILWVAYDTPVSETDKADVNFVVSQIEALLPFVPSNVTVLISSQMPVGSTQRLEALAKRIVPNKGLRFVCIPENLRLGKAIDAFLRPDRIIVGLRADRDRERIGHLFAPITNKLEWMSVESAEMTKHAINSFLATSVAFANEIATLCEVVGADAKEVERGLKSEQRIGVKAYLSPGGAFAGGTLARDIEYLKSIGVHRSLSIPLLKAVKKSNDAHKHWARHRLKALIPDLNGTVIAIWGLTYKPCTDTLRRSLAVELCTWLAHEGAQVKVHDPVAAELPGGLQRLVTRFDDPLEALKGAQALIVGTEWPQYKRIAVDIGSQAPNGLIVIDANRFLLSLAAVEGVRHFAVGTISAGGIA